MSRGIRGSGRGVLGAAVAALLVLAASAVFIPPIAAATDDEPTIEVKRAIVKRAGISLAYPKDWTVVALTPKEVRAARRATVKRNPKLGVLIDEEAQVQAGKNSQFAAADIDAALAGEVSSIVEVRSGSGFELPMDETLDVVAEQLEKAGATVLDRAPVMVSGSPGMRMDSRLEATAVDGTRMTLRMSQLLAEVHGRSVVVTIASSDDAAGTATIDRVLTSVRAA